MLPARPNDPKATRGSAATVGGLHHPTAPTRDLRPRHRGEETAQKRRRHDHNEKRTRHRFVGEDAIVATCISGGERSWSLDGYQIESKEDLYMYTQSIYSSSFLGGVQHVKEIFTDMCIPVAA
jgi:hypothetical protein